MKSPCLSARFPGILAGLAAIVLSVSKIAVADTYFEVIDGVTWAYSVSGGEAVIGSDGGSSALVTVPSTGAVTIPSTLGGKPVTRIGSWAFSPYSDLTSVTIPDSVTSIGYMAFYNCSGLMSMTIPDSVTNIENSAFSGCSGLTSVTIGNGVTNIGDYAFYWCSGLTSVTIGNGVRGIGESAFYNCSLTSVTIPNSVTSIGDRAFSGCSGLTSVTIGNGVTNIGDYAFYWCGGLTSLAIPDSVTSIGVGAFKGCDGLTSVTIGSGVTSIGDSAFCVCWNLTSVTIPDSVARIGDYAFQWCDLTSVTIPASVTSIGWYAFEGCGITSLVVDASNPVYDSRGGCNAIILTADNTLLAGCENTKIPDTVTGIGDGAFSASDIASVTIPDSVTSIGESAFEGCSLTSVTIPGTVTSIGDSAFGWCYDLASVTIGSGVTSIGDSAFCGCCNLISVTIPDTVTSIGSWAFGECDGLPSLAIPDSVTSIGDYAFAPFDEDDALERLYLPSRFFGDLERLGVSAKCTVINSDIYAFVKRLYRLCLGRDPDQGGIDNWSMQLASGANDGANVAFGFFMSQEMTNRGLSNADFVEVLYNVMMGRASDAGGKADWVSALEGGVTRIGVLRGFAESAEFTNICGSYGINRGSVNPAYLENRDQNSGITKFVARCYTKALGRAYDVDGLNYWCQQILSSPNPKATAIYVSTTGFFDSLEFQLRRLDNGAFVDVLYETFLGRAADAGGRANWVSQLNAGADRHNVMAGFYNSAEFNAIMAGYGIY